MTFDPEQFAAAFVDHPRGRHVEAVVTSVNADGTVNLSMPDGGQLESQAAAVSYQPRNVGDRVAVEFGGGLYRVTGKIGAPTSPGPRLVVSDVNAPAGYTEIQTVWVGEEDGTSVLWFKRVTPAPVASGVLTVAATSFARYRDGSSVGSEYAEQGGGYGYGLHTGFAFFPPDAFAPLAAKAITGVTVSLHRRNSSHGPAGPTTIRLLLHNLLTAPASAGPGDLFVAADGLRPTVTAGRNADAEVAAPPSWGEALRDGTAKGVGIYTPTLAENAEVDRLSVTINYT